jgi:hypothetical protein
VQILEHEHDRPALGAALRDGVQGVEDALPSRGGLHGENRFVSRIDRQEIAQERDVLLDLPHPPRAVLDLGDDLRLAVDLGDSEARPELVDEGEKRNRPAERHAVAFEPHRPLAGLGEAAAKLVNQPRFSDPGVAGEEDDLPPAALRLAEQVLQLRELALAADERGQAALHGHLEAGAAALRSYHLEGAHRRLVSLDPQLAQVAGLEESLDRSMRGLRDQHRPRRAERLETRGHVRRVALGRVVHPQVVADPPDHDRAGVEPDAHAQADDAVARLEVAPVVSERALNPEGGVHRPARTVLVGDGRAEQRHDAVAPILVDRPLEAMDLGGDPLEAALHDAVDVLGVELLSDRSEASAIREQHGDYAPLTLEGAATGEDLLSEVLGCVGSARLDGGCGRRRRCRGFVLPAPVTAAAAEAGARPCRAPAGETRRAKSRSPRDSRLSRPCNAPTASVPG